MSFRVYEDQEPFVEVCGYLCQDDHDPDLYGPPDFMVTLEIIRIAFHTYDVYGESRSVSSFWSSLDGARQLALSRLVPNQKDPNRLVRSTWEALEVDWISGRAMLDPYEMERLEQAIFRLWWDLGDRDSIRAMLEHYRGRLAVQCDGIEDALALLARLESLGETSPSAQDERIIALWREGFTGTDIAGRLSLAPGTVQNRVVQLRHSLGEVQVPYHR